VSRFLCPVTSNLPSLTLGPSSLNTLLTRLLRLTSPTFYRPLTEPLWSISPLTPPLRRSLGNDADPDADADANASAQVTGCFPILARTALDTNTLTPTTAHTPFGCFCPGHHILSFFVVFNARWAGTNHVPAFLLLFVFQYNSLRSPICQTYAQLVFLHGLSALVTVFTDTGSPREYYSHHAFSLRFGVVTLRWHLQCVVLVAYTCVARPTTGA
jgi:hypothetical protein